MSATTSVLVTWHSNMSFVYTFYGLLMFALGGALVDCLRVRKNFVMESYDYIRQNLRQLLRWSTILKLLLRNLDLESLSSANRGKTSHKMCKRGCFFQLCQHMSMSGMCLFDKDQQCHKFLFDKDQQCRKLLLIKINNV